MRNKSRYWKQKKGILTLKPSSSVMYSGATTPRKKPLGSIEKIFEIINHTYC
jgi:hypothetical protein